MLVEEQQGAQGLMMGRSRNASFIGQVRQKGADFGSSHIGGMAGLVKADIPSGPVHVDALGTQAIVLISEATSQLIEQFRWLPGSSRIRGDFHVN